jgi:hypothetical protein
LNHLSGQNPGLAQLPSPVRPKNAIRGRSKIAAGCNNPNACLVGEFALNANNPYPSSFVTKAASLDELLSGGAIIDQQSGESPSGRLAGQPNAELRIDDAPGEEQILGRDNIAGILHKERTLFGKENLKTLVDRNLWLNGLDWLKSGFTVVQSQ